MQQRTNKQGKQNFTLKQVEAVFADAPNRMDAERGQRLGSLSNIKRAKLVQSRRERARVEARYGKEHPRVRQADERMRLQHHQLVNTRVEANRSQIEMVERDQASWILHGYVRNQEGSAIAKARVALYRDKDGYQEEVMEVISNSSGYFNFCFSPSREPPSDETPSYEMPLSEKARQPASTESLTQAQNKAELEKKRRQEETMSAAARNEAAADKGAAYMIRRAATLVKQPVYLGAASAGSKHMDSRSLYPAPGTVIYRDIELNVADSDSCQLRTRYLGNSSTRELHDLHSEKANCKIAAMRPDHRVYFVSENQAQAIGYDFCAKCYGQSRSKI